MNKKLVSAILCGAMVLTAATPVLADGGVADGKKIALDEFRSQGKLR